MIIKRIISGLSLLVCSGIISTVSVSAQSKIEGQIFNHKSEPVPFANVLLLTASDSAFHQGAVTDDRGLYIIENISTGTYFVVGTSLGYKKTYSEIISISASSVYNQNLILQENSVDLSEVLVEAERPMFEHQVDRLVVNLQNSATSEGNTALEILQKLPGIVINRQNNVIVLNGKSGVRVMINGKMMQLPIDTFIQILDGMSAASIEKIELITAPPAKYDAEGEAGIIHIVLKESMDVGTNGSIGATLGYRWAENVGGHIAINHRTKHSAYFLDYSGNRNHNRHFWKAYYTSHENDFVQTVSDTSNRKNVTTIHNFRTDAEWKIGNRSSLDVLMTAYRNKWILDAVTDNNNIAGENTRIFTRMNIWELNDWKSMTSGLRWHTLFNERNELTIDVDFLSYENDNPSTYENNVTTNSNSLSEEEIIEVKKSTPIRFVIGKFDYSLTPSKQFRVDAGAKAVRSQLDNDVAVDRVVDDNRQVDPRFTSFAHLIEKIGAGYFEGKYHGKNGVRLNAGLRYEYTSTTVTAPGDGEVLDRHYSYFFPSFFIQKPFTKNKDIQFSYSRRITRPTFRDIAPFVFFWNANTFSAGNTSLWPAISDGLKAGVQLKAWIFSLQFSRSKNEITFFQPELNHADNTIIYRSQNLRYLNSLGISSSWSFSLAKWWEVQTNFTGQFQKAVTKHLEENTSIEMYNFNASVVNMVTLPRQFTLEVSGFYNSRSVFGISEFQPISSVNIGLQKKIGKKGTLTLSIDDIFYDNVWTARTRLPQLNFNSAIQYDYHVQFVRFTYTRNLGNKKLKPVNIQSGSEEERRRVD